MTDHLQPDEPNLTGELQLTFTDRLRRRDVVVRRVEDVTRRYRRVVLGVATDDGSGEVGFPLVRFAPGDHVKVYFPHPVTGDLVAYRDIGSDHGDGERWELDGLGEPIRRDYTPRAWDPVAGELTIDMVLHDHGVAGRWARAARPGDRLVVIGPRANWRLPENYGHYLAVGDETALPAISRLVEEAPPQARVTALVEVADVAEEQQLGGGPLRLVHWVHRDTAPVAPGHVSALETALKAVELPGPLDDLYVFAAGETAAMRAIRRHMRSDLGLPKRQVVVDGYWKRGTADFDHHTGELDGD